MRHAPLSISVLFVLLAWAASCATAPSPSLPPDVGGRHFTICLMAQTVAHYGLFTLNPYMTLAGAIAGGISCGLAW